LADSHNLWSCASFLVPVSVNLDGGIYINAAVRLTQYEEKYGAANVKNLELNGEDELAFSASVGKKRGKDLDAYVGAKVAQVSEDSADLGGKKNGFDFGLGLKVAFN
jgi:hypothetical protein